MMRKEDIGIVACSAHHQMVTDTRCFVTDRQISFDLVADHLGPARRDLPHTVAFHSQIPEPSAEGIGATHPSISHVEGSFNHMTQARARGPTPSCKQVYFDLCTVYESVCPSAGEGTKCRCTSRIVARRQTSAFRVKPRNATIATRNKPAPQRARHSSAGAHTARHRSRAIEQAVD